MFLESNIFKCLRKLSLIMVLVTAPAYAADSTELFGDLSQYQWKNRILLITSPSESDNLYRDQAASLLKVYPGLLERDLIVLTRFGEAKFSVTLIGKDGGVKLQREELLSTAELFAVIDAMPMRRAEMQD